MFFVFVQDIKFVKIYSILFDQCMNAVGFQCNVARCAVGVISVCVKVLNVFMFLIMFFMVICFAQRILQLQRMNLRLGVV